MTTEEIREKALAVKDPVKEYLTVYELLDELGVKYKKTNCHRCRIDLYNILREELCLIESAAEMSEFNGLPEGAELVYIFPSPVKFRDKIIKKTSSQKDMMELYRVHPQFFMVQNTIPLETNETN